MNNQVQYIEHYLERKEKGKKARERKLQPPQRLMYNTSIGNVTMYRDVGTAVRTKNQKPGIGVAGKTGHTKTT